MNHNSSRKQFFAKLLGVVAASSLIPKLFAKSAVAPQETVQPTASRSFAIRHDSRVVSRREVI